MSDKKFVILTTGISDTLCSSNSRKKIRNNEEFVNQVEKVLEHLTKDKKNYGIVNYHYPSDTFKDVDVFSKYPKTKVIEMKIHSPRLLVKDNELIINSLDGEELLFNGDEFSFIFRPEEYDVYICGIDLHGIFTNTIQDLLESGYNVSLFSDCLSALPITRKFISTIDKSKSFQFCSYKSM